MGTSAKLVDRLCYLESLNREEAVNRRASLETARRHRVDRNHRVLATRESPLGRRSEGLRDPHSRLGYQSYQSKQPEVRAGECHLVEIDLLRRGRHVMSVPESHLPPAKPFDYLICLNRWPARKRFEIYPCLLRDSLPVIDIPLADPDPDVPLAIQTALEQVYDEGNYMLRVQYDQPCVPSLSAEDQEWAAELWSAYRRAHPDLIPDENNR
jgi:Protein of unknown function (DUF4058)